MQHADHVLRKIHHCVHISSVKVAVFLAKFLNNISTKISIYPTKFPNDLFLVIRTKFSIELHTIAYFRHWTDDYYCKNGLSSLHISIHHSTFCASLHS